MLRTRVVLMKIGQQQANFYSPLLANRYVCLAFTLDAALTVGCAIYSIADATSGGISTGTKREPFNHKVLRVNIINIYCDK